MSLLLYLLAGYGLLQLFYCLFIYGIRKVDTPSPTATRTFLPSSTTQPTHQPAFLLIHGFADTPEAWQREATYLAAQGAAVVCPLLSHDEDETAWIKTLQAAAKTLRPYSNELWIVAHSMGATLALLAVRELQPKGLVLWAPFFRPRLGHGFTTALYYLHRTLFLSPFTLTFFPSKRTAHGSPETTYYVRHVIARKTFHAMLTLPQKVNLANLPSLPLLVLLSQRDTVVDNRATYASLPTATYQYAVNPTSSHALTNAEDWKENLLNTLAYIHQTHA